MSDLLGFYEYRYFLSNLNNIFDENCIKTDSLNKEKYRNDWSTDHQSNPIAVVFPKETEQVIEVLKLCNEFKYPLIGSGGRTGLSGGASATSEELIVSFDKMNSILEFDENSNTVLCQPGLITQNLQAFADDNNLYYPVDFHQPDLHKSEGILQQMLEELEY